MASSSASTSQLRLLILSPARNGPSTAKPSPFAPLLQGLTFSAPAKDVSTFAGYTTHPPLHLRTKYYEKNVSIWCDEMPPAVRQRKRTTAESGEGWPDDDDEADLAQWQEQMTSATAREVRDAIGGIALLLPLDPQVLANEKPDEPTTLCIQTAHFLRDTIEDESGGRDVASLIVLQPADPAAVYAKEPAFIEQLDKFAQKLEDWCHELAIFGWDFVSWTGVTNPATSITKNTNEFGEKTGIERIKEVLEAVDWSASIQSDVDDPTVDDDDGLDVFSSKRFQGLDAELQQEMMGLKLSMIDGGGSKNAESEDMSPDQMAGLMQRVVAIRDAGVELPEAERKAFAKREVEKLVRELS